MKNEFLSKINDEHNVNHGGYGATLFDPRWKAKRIEILSRDGNKCKICKSPEQLQVHHRQYHFSTILNAFKDPWDYSNHLMVTLCQNCHQKGHRIYKVPTKYVK
jgi:5-methylcytosine-specific restriction endonuclease McrA